MPLRDSRIRRALEHALHGVAAIALVLAGWIALKMLDERPSALAAGLEVSTAVARWSTSEAPARAHVTFTEMPAPELRDWIAALEKTATDITWEGPVFAASGLVVEPVPDPKRPTRIWVAAPAGADVVIRDSLGTLASVRAGTEKAGGVAVTAPHVEGTVTARVNGAEATAVMSDALDVKRVLILGAAGWEGKFILASLEEYGWKVDARLRVSPKEAVVQGPPAPTVDFERYSAVIALDATAARHARAIGDFVRAGGGFIAVGDAAGLPAFASLLGARLQEPSDDGDFAQEPGKPHRPSRHALSLSALTNLKDDALPLERGPNDAIATVARRAGDGRVLQVGYRDTWRWRMAGTEADPVGAHRKWWAAMVSSVAHAQRTPVAAPDVLEPTPLASLVATLGTAQTQPRQAALARLLDSRFLPYLFAIALFALLLEWFSRRVRGAP